MKSLHCVLVGPPGCGKGTQAEALIRMSGSRIVHISTGDLLREEIRAESSLGLKAKSIMDAGGLVPDNLVFELIECRLNRAGAEDGFILDGFPRTIAQAEQLQALLAKRGVPLDCVILFEVPESVLAQRICGRRVHVSSGRTYHVDFHPPKVEGVDDVTGEPLVQRVDDNFETLQKRLKNYHSWTEDLIDYYAKRKLLKRVNAAGDPPTVTLELVKVVKEWTRRQTM